MRSPSLRVEVLYTNKVAPLLPKVRCLAFLTNPFLEALIHKTGTFSRMVQHYNNPFLEKRLHRTNKSVCIPTFTGRGRPYQYVCVCTKCASLNLMTSVLAHQDSRDCISIECCQLAARQASII